MILAESVRESLRSGFKYVSATYDHPYYTVTERMLEESSCGCGPKAHRRVRCGKLLFVFTRLYRDDKRLIRTLTISADAPWPDGALMIAAVDARPFMGRPSEFFFVDRPRRVMALSWVG